MYIMLPKELWHATKVTMISLIGMAIVVVVLSATVLYLCVKDRGVYMASMGMATQRIEELQTRLEQAETGRRSAESWVIKQKEKERVYKKSGG